jgi:hypothetical protein
VKTRTEQIESWDTFWQRAILALLLVLILASVFGCTSLGLTTPQSPQQSIAYGYSGVTAALNTLAQMTSAGAISSTNAIKANSAILNAKAILDDANQAAASSSPTALTLITSATQALAQVSAYLTCTQEKQASCQL